MPTESLPLEGIDPKLVLMPTWTIDDRLISDVLATEPQLSHAIQQVAKLSVRNTHGLAYSFCIDETRREKMSVSSLLAEIDSAKASRAKHGLHPEITMGGMSKEKAATICPVGYRPVDYNVACTMDMSKELPREVTIAYRDAAAAVNGVSAVRLKLGYAKSKTGEPFTYVRSVQLITQ